MKYHGSTLITGRQVHGGHGTNALPIKDYILRADAIPNTTQK